METFSHNNHSHKKFSPFSFFAGLVLALALFFIIYKFASPKNESEKKVVVKDTLQSEQFESENTKDGINYYGEHFYKEHHHRHIDQDAEPMVVSSHEMTALEKGNLSARQKKMLALLPNAPVIYIYDLKITDYQTLYFDADGKAFETEKKTTAAQLLHEALKSFSFKNFEDCFTKMNVLANANSNDVNALFYSGMSAYYKKNYTEAEARFQKVIISANNVFRQEAEWFSAMTLFENNKRDESKKLLQKIIDDKGFYTNRAAEILKQLIK